LPSGGVAGSITLGLDNNLWSLETVLDGNGQSIEKIGRISPSGDITEFVLPAGNADGLKGGPADITAARDWALWFTDAANNAIGRITTSGTISEIALPTLLSAPAYITAFHRVRSGLQNRVSMGRRRNWAGSPLGNLLTR
jgi:virginiamycin B lyase